MLDTRSNGVPDATTFTSDSSRVTGERSTERRVTTHLYTVLDCERLHDAASRYALDGIHTIRIGRGDTRTARRTSSDELLLTLPDRRASREHARLRVREGHWTIEDAGSKNGVFLNGCQVQGSATVAQGNIIEVGHTFFTLRNSTAPPLADVTGFRPDPKEPATATLLPEVVQAFATLASFARADGHVTILGETGSGKDVLANAYHRLTRRSGAFVPVNCGALPSSLVEAMLFGHRQGAYTGAAASNEGLVRAADGGTLFLDEVGDLPLSAQAALLRVLEAREVLPVGCSKPVRVDVRVVCATHRDIPAMVVRGEFREDLWARLAGLVISLRPLRERLEDLGLLVSAAVMKHARGRADRIRLMPSVGREILSRRWPLNTRELINAIGHAIAVAKNDTITTDHLPSPAVTRQAHPRPGDRWSATS